jgi:ribosomal protein S20
MVPTTKIPLQLRSDPLAKTPRTWTGARTPSGLKRVRQAARRHEVLGPRRSAAKTYVAKALTLAVNPVEGEDPTAALIEALSALDRAAKAGAIHPNAAARRKSRLTRKVNAALGGASVQTSARVTKQTGKAAAAKAAKARIAAGKSTKAKGAQTAAGKARAALSKTARAEAAAAAAAAAAGPAVTPEAPAKATKATTKPAAKAATKTAKVAAKAPAKPAAKATTAKPTATAKAAPKKKAAPKE